MQSTVEIEVWKWTDCNKIEVHKLREYLPFFIRDSEGKEPTDKVFYSFP
jgi:hypothetical protein